MKYTVILLCAFCASCVTAGEMADLTTKWAAVEAATNANSTDHAAALEAFGTKVAEVADAVDKREKTADGIVGFGAAADSTGIAALAVAGLHFFRESRRKKRGEVSGSEKVSPTR